MEGVERRKATVWPAADEVIEWDVTCTWGQVAVRGDCGVQGAACAQHAEGVEGACCSLETLPFAVDSGVAQDQMDNQVEVRNSSKLAEWMIGWPEEMLLVA